MPDRYFVLTYKLDGRTTTEAVTVLAELKEARRLGKGPSALREKRALEDAATKEQAQRTKAEAKGYSLV